MPSSPPPATSHPVLDVQPLGFPWVCVDPFLFCVHHDDAYPEGNEQLGPAASLTGRQLGQDFAGKDGWRMYHGAVVPGFPQHPHRGFETVTIVRKGLIDHSDSLGAAARFGHGDVQWLTAGEGIVHSEMFPLLEKTKPNPLELFQIWLNLPGSDKMAPPHFAMLWDRDVPRSVFTDEAGRTTEVAVIAGELGGRKAPPPPPRSWAARVDTEVAIWTVRLSPGAKWTLPRTKRDDVARTIYFFRGPRLRIDNRDFTAHSAMLVRADFDLRLEAGDEECELLLLQGRPIDEPIAQQGPFVMNTHAELRQAFTDYQRTWFGGWPWPADDPVHGREEGRFARHADGKVERMEKT